MARGYFETDGIRCLASQYPLAGEGPVDIGRAVGTNLVQVGDTAVITHDGRNSGERIVAGLAEGFNQVGVNVELAGILPTPGIAQLTRDDKKVGIGVQVTASHNGPKYNGVKVFSEKGEKLPDHIEEVLNDGIVNGVPDRGRGITTTRFGSAAAYEDFLVGSADGADFSGLNIGIDTANGAASGIAQRAFQRLGANVVSIADNPNGFNINDNCGATSIDTDNPGPLQRLVVEQKLHMGAAKDGDADRLIMVDEFGREVTGDHIMYILAKTNGYKGVVSTAMTNLGTEIAMREAGIKLVREDVGDRYVLRGLQATGYKIGGENSGHIILPHKLFTGDGTLAAIATVRAVRESGRSLAEWRDDITMLPQKLVNFPLADKSLLTHPEVLTYQAQLNVSYGGLGRALLRASGTEPVGRVMIELQGEADGAKKEALRVAEELQALLARLSTRDTVLTNVR